MGITNVVAHNLPSMYSNRQLGLTRKNNAKSAEKLASGYRINRAADDAAGLSISEKMRKQIRGLRQGSENVEDGISFCQVADGALNEVSDMLNRIKELSIKSANGTNSASDREAIDAEVQQIKKETERIFETTRFNERLVWPRETKDIIAYKGASVTAVTYPSQYAYPDLSSANAKTWPPNGFRVSADADNGLQIKWKGYDGVDYTSDTVKWPDNLAGTHTIRLSELLSSYEDPVTHELPDKLKGIDAVFSYNANVNTEISDLVQDLNNGVMYISPSTSHAISIYDSNGNRITSGISATVSLDYPAVAKSGRNLDNASDTSFAQPTSFNNLVEPQSDGSGNWSGTWKFSFDFENIGTVTASVKQINYRLNSSDEIDRDSSDDKKYDAANGNNYTYSGYVYHNSNDRWWGDQGNFRWNSSSGSYTWNGYQRNNHVVTVANAAGITMNDINTALNNSTDRGGLLDDHDGKRDDSGYIEFIFNLTADTPFDLGNGTNFTSVGSMKVTVSTNETDTAEDVRNRILNMHGADIYAGSSNGDGTGSVGGHSMRVYSSFPTHQKTVTIPFVEDVIVFSYNNMSIHSADTSYEKVKIPISYKYLRNEVIGLKDTNVLTEEDALRAIDEVEAAARSISEERSVFGAYQNRLEHTVRNLDNVVENTTAAESQIRDTDMATEMVRYSNNNILMQAGQSMLAQANQSNQGVLSLLG